MFTQDNILLIYPSIHHIYMTYSIILCHIYCNVKDEQNTEDEKLNVNFSNSQKRNKYLRCFILRLYTYAMSKFPWTLALQITDLSFYSITINLHEIV